MPAPNLINAEHLTKGYGTRILLDDVSLGISAGAVIGVVGRNGDGKSTLLGLLTGTVEPDEGRVTQTGGISVGVLTQAEVPEPGRTIRDLVVHGEPDHVWARNHRSRQVVDHLLGGLELDRELTSLSGGERRRAGLVSLLIADHDLLVLDEPTNHLDVEAVGWLAKHLNELQDRGTAMLIVSHDRWFLDAVCTNIWEVHDGIVEAYEGGYAAYVLARAERARQAAATEARRKNLVRKELAWLRRGAPARTSKPKFRIDAANALIADVPEPRDRMELQKFAMSRLGNDVIDLFSVDATLPDGRKLLDDVTWSIGPGDRIGIIGVNGSGKSTLFNTLSGDREPDAGKVKHGLTLRPGYLTQQVAELDGDDRVLDSVNRLKEQTKLATGREATATTLLEDFGFTGTKLVTRVGDLSGGERRRLQLLRLLISEPNVLILDEPTNDLDIDTLNVVEDYLDTWPGTLIVASHDRYFLERVTDVQYALLGDGQLSLLPGGIDQYLEIRAEQTEQASASVAPNTNPASDAARQRAAKKEVNKIEGQLKKATAQIEKIQEKMAKVADDYTKLATLQTELDDANARHSELEEAWLLAAEDAEGS